NSNILKNNDIIPSTVQSKSSSSGSSKGQEDTLSFLDKLKNINPDIFLGVGDFITSAMGINKSSQKMKDSFKKKMIGSQKQMPIEFYSTYRDNGLFRMYGDRINNIRQFKTATNDPNQVTSERLMRDQQVDQLANERDTKLSQMVGDFNDKLLAQKQQYSNMRTQVANDNKNN
ncbi:hypothetical protein, partial [Clostridium sp.]|uniref:hypothetical protein n=1 Tax=Clostridium sp. TaxID=1506 RepID=UPI002FC5EAB0